MKVKVSPGWSSSGEDHHIEDGYLVLDEVVETVFLDGEPLDIDIERYYEVARVEDESPRAIRLFSSESS